MGVIRGEKVTFRKKDIVSLHHLPSAQVEDPLIVHCPESPSHVRRLSKFCGLIIVVLALLIGALVATVEGGMFDAPLSRNAQMALDMAIGPRYKAEVGSTVIRFDSGLRLALEARNVNLVDQESGKHLSTTAVMRMALDPLALLRGHISVTDIEAEGIALDTALLPSGDPLTLADMRVDAIPTGLESVFSNLDVLDNFVARSGTDSVRISGLDLKFDSGDGKPLSLVVDNLSLARTAPETLQLSGEIAVDGAVAQLNVTAQKVAGRAASLTATLANADLTPFMLRRDAAGEPRQGISSLADVTVSAKRADAGPAPSLTAEIAVKPGEFFMDGNSQELSGAEINLAYSGAAGTLEILKSNAQFAATNIPFTGALIDLDKLDPSAGKGFGVDLLVSGGTAATAASGEAALAFDAHAEGRYLTDGRELQFNSLTVSSPLGALYGSLHVKLGDSSPEISFVGQSQQIQTAAVKQLWPFWMATRARNWVQQNLFGGTVSNASISVFIPAGALDAAIGRGLRLTEQQLHITLDIADTRMNVAGAIPPIRDTVGHVDVAGSVVTVDIKGGTSYFASGRSVTVGTGRFVIPSTFEKPLMAQLNLDVSGTADSIAELLTYKPIQVLQRTGFQPDELRGNVTASVEARFGLVQSQDPPAPDWKATMHLTDLDVGKEIAGRKITNFAGELDADPQSVRIDGKAQIDGIPAELSLVEPTSASSGTPRERVITMTLNNSQREGVMPGLSSLIDGTIKVELTRLDDDRQAVKVDLTQATLVVPWVGWTKGAGIAASAEFEASGPPDATSIKDFQLKGDGFGADGELLVGKGGLVSADLSSVKLSSVDDFAVSVDRNKGAYDVSVSGAAADARPILARLKSAGPAGGDGDSSAAVAVRIKLGRIVGFNDESIDNFEGLYSTRGGRLRALNFSGVTDSGQAVVTKMTGDGGNGTIYITSGDAGATARFADFYRHMDGGLLNLTINMGAGDNWSGSVDIRRFALVNEQRLRSIVSTPVGDDQRSLNSAVRRDIDTSAQRFQRGFARIVSRGGVITIENGVARGDQVGATFQGTIRDRNGNMDMTGTFMPAYGLNRLFAELPFIGVLLGNGSDRGLIGITFRLTGKFDSPYLQINPLSLIAPGVFRQIFEFQ
ncbi:AsmA-like C-terminal region-containing protein [Rhizobium sp. BK251]|uniref:YhdP family protein n=1 Tax=Rhizobium sp. BK251 TaxID=2512125 RepID=UPI0010491A4D|nr:AsmA-like C-terminal region-containing protein [Rhizobium sp. BK251]